LLIRPGAIGDSILSLPAMECLRTTHLEVWAASAVLPLFRFADAVDSIAGSSLDMLGLPGREAPARLLDRLRGFDSIVSWYGANRPEFRAAVEKLGLPFHFFDALPVEETRIHAADFYLAQARTLARCDAPAIPRIGCPRQDEGFAVIHPFSGSPKKNWPLERFRELAAWLEKRLPVHWCAGPNEDWKVPGEVEAWRIENLHELACRLACARLYIGNDSGITHLAAAAGAPVVALFGPTDPAVWAPRGARVRIVATPEPGQAMADIPLDAVVAAVRQLLAGR
jgi:ADP-heptose:LPS heptosyltransferase